MIRALRFLLFVSAVLGDRQKCDDPEQTSYISFAGELNEAQSIGEYCECQRKSLEARGLWNSTIPFECRINPDISALELKSSPYNEDTGCKECLGNCENVIGDPNKVCKVILAPDSGTVLPRTTFPLAQRVRITIFIVFRRFSITIVISW